MTFAGPTVDKLIYHYLDGPFDGRQETDRLLSEPLKMRSKVVYRESEGRTYAEYHQQRKFECGSVTHVLYQYDPE